MPTPPRRNLTLWRLTDGKPGHEKQSLGLARALAGLIGVDCHDLRVSGGAAALSDWLLGRFPPGRGLPDPDLILAAGHATHLPALAARRSRGGRIVVLMRPSLPIALFDLCLIPEHDDPPVRDEVIATRGVLNTLTPADHNEPSPGLMLIGGPSPHYRWDGAAVVRQIETIARATPDTAWRLTTSRRTPPDFLAGLAACPLANLEIVPHTATPAGWVEAHLARSGQAWVTEDSVSMLYEALTAGCGVGLLRLPAAGEGRVSRGIARLIAEGWITPFEAWRLGQALRPPPTRFDEAERCARLILDRWFADRR